MITDRAAVRMALYLAIDCEETENTKTSRRRVAAFKRVLGHYFGGYETLKRSKAVSILSLLRPTS